MRKQVSDDGGGGSRISSLYVILSHVAPAALEMLHTDFGRDLYFGYQVLLQWEMSDLCERFQSVNGQLRGSQRIVTIAWAFCEKLSIAQQRALSVCMTQVYHESSSEPGWWLWDGTNAACRPWAEMSEGMPYGPSHSPHGKFAKSSDHSYAYPWS